MGPCAVVVSSVDDRAVMASCLQLGAADFLIKPLRANELRNLWARVYWWRRVRPLGSSEPEAEVRRPGGAGVAATQRGSGALDVLRGSHSQSGRSRACGGRASAVGDENILDSRKLEVSAPRLVSRSVLVRQQRGGWRGHWARLFGGQHGVRAHQHVHVARACG